MDNSTCNDLIMEIGSLILQSDEYSNDHWEGISVVGDFSNGQQAMHGYVYFEDGDFEARTPSFDALRKIRELRREMKKEKDKEWHQCLIHITRPDYKINIKFEYENPHRWSVKGFSGGLNEFAEILKPSA